MLFACILESVFEDSHFFQLAFTKAVYFTKTVFTLYYIKKAGAPSKLNNVHKKVSQFPLSQSDSDLFKYKKLKRLYHYGVAM